MTMPKCPHLMSYGGGFEFRPCNRPATREKFCALHDPNRPDKLKRREEARERFERRCQPPPLPETVVAVLKILNEERTNFDLLSALKETRAKWIAAGRPGLPKASE